MASMFKPSMPEDFFFTNIENVCRICLQTDVPLSSIFRDEVEEMLSEFLPDKIDLRDNFPQQICKKCLDDVKIAYAFKKQAEYSHEVIKKMLDGKRLPRSSNKKSYQEINENNIFRTKTLPSDPVNGTRFVCHICDRTLLRKNILKRHLQRVHKFFNFEVYGDLFAINKSPSKPIKQEEESYIEEMTFPILPQVIMVDDDNDMQVDEGNEEDEPSMEERDDPFRSHNEDFNDSPYKLTSSTPLLDHQMQTTFDEQQTTFECHICYKRLTRRYYLKCHLERVHKYYSTDTIKPKLIPLKISKPIEHIEKPKIWTGPSSSNLSRKENNDKKQDSSAGTFECRICKKSLSRRYGLKKHYELVHNIVENDKPIDLTYDGLSDDHEKNVPVKRFEDPKPIKVKTESIPNLKRKTKSVNVYICHICEKEFSGRATMRRHLKNVHKFQDFEDNIWLSKVHQKAVEIEGVEVEAEQQEEEEEEDNAFVPNIENEFDQSYKHDEDIDMHAYLLCPEVVLTTGDDNNLGTNNGKHGENNDRDLSNIGSTSRAEFDFNVINMERFKRKEVNKKIPNKVEPLKLKLDVLAIKNIKKPNPPKVFKNIFACTYCKKPFNRYDHLKRHEGTHTKPYKCQFCGKGFYRDDLLIRHEKSAHSAHSKLYGLQQKERDLLQSEKGPGQPFNYNLDIMDINKEYETKEPNFKKENSFENNENDNYDQGDDDDDDEDDDDDDQKNFDESEQNSNQGSSVTDANKEDSNADTAESSIKDVRQADSNVEATKNSVRDTQDVENTNNQQNSNLYTDFDWSHIL